MGLPKKLKCIKCKYVWKRRAKKYPKKCPRCQNWDWRKK